MASNYKVIPVYFVKHLPSGDVWDRMANCWKPRAYFASNYFSNYDEAYNFIRRQGFSFASIEKVFLTVF